MAEFKVSMHCNACERSVAKTIAKIKGCHFLLSLGRLQMVIRVVSFVDDDSHSIFEGVQEFKTDMNRHVVEVTGMIDPQKVLKKLRKKTGKRVEMLGSKKDGDAPKDEPGAGGGSQEQGPVVAHEQNAHTKTKFDYCCVENETLMMFSDENPNACCTM